MPSKNSEADLLLLFSQLGAVLKKEFGYLVDIDKYKLFMDAFTRGWVPVDDYPRFLRFCQFMFLEQHSDKARFEQVIESILQDEMSKIWALSKVVNPSLESPPVRPTSKSEGSTPAPLTRQSKNPLPEPPPIRESRPEKTTPQTETRYLNLEAILGLERTPEGRKTKPASSSMIQFIQSDEYFSLTRREMIKKWKYLRHKEKSGQSEEIDIAATIQRIAKEGLFLEPVYQPGQGNRANTLVILADWGGSMVAFHELIERLIHTARMEGGLADVESFYFRNYPSKYLYQKPDLSGPIRIEEAFRAANPNFTVAMVLSDAGAARGRFVQKRVEATIGTDVSDPMQAPSFLERLQQHFAFIVWLNPLPRHRWAGTSAEPVAEKLGSMYPIMDTQELDFQFIIKSLMSRKIF